MVRIRFNSLSLLVLVVAISVSATRTQAGAAPAPTPVAPATPAVTDLKKQISSAMLAGRCDEAKELAIKAVEFDLAEQVVRLCVPKGQVASAPTPAVKAGSPAPVAIDLKVANDLYKQKRYSEAFPLYEQASLAGSGEAANMLGQILQYGYGTNIDLSNSVDYYKLSASRGDIFGQFNFGYMNYLGLGTTRDYQVAYSFFKSAAENGHSDAQNNLGVMYQNGFFVSKNLTEALRYYKLAARNGSSLAQENIAHLVDVGAAKESDFVLPQSGNHLANWKRRPTMEQLATFYPKEAILNKVTGSVRLFCGVDVAGFTTECRIISEDPIGMGFGQAAIKLAKISEFTPAIVNGKPAAGSVAIPFKFTLPDSMFDRLIKALTAQK